MFQFPSNNELQTVLWASQSLEAVHVYLGLCRPLALHYPSLAAHLAHPHRFFVCLLFLRSALFQEAFLESQLGMLWLLGTEQALLCRCACAYVCESHSAGLTVGGELHSCLLLRFTFLKPRGPSGSPELYQGQHLSDVYGPN